MTSGRVTLAVLLGALSAAATAFAQTDRGAWAAVELIKVATGREAAFEQLMTASWKPVYEQAKKAGRITNWALYRVHFSGANDEYNYAAVTYLDSWARTQAAGDIAALVRASDTKIDVAAAIGRLDAVRTVVRRPLYSRLELVTAPVVALPKFLMMDYMKVKDGMLDEYLKVEREDWKPLHQVLANEGNRVGWALWDYAVPGGTGSSHDFVTAMMFTDYGQIKEANDGEAFTKAHPGKDLAASVARTRRSRDVVRSELWETVLSLP